MRFENVRLAAFGHALPDEVVTSDALEDRIAPLYERLGMSVGRLELMSGIRERRFWPRGTRPSAVAARAAEDALARCDIARESIGYLIHSSVCRDFLEPATASVVHAQLGLHENCMVYDLSNACLGFANAMLVVAGEIERGAIDAGLVVAGEDGRALVEETLRALSAGEHIGRAEVKRAYASLTIGSGAAALVLARADHAPRARRLVGATVLAATEHHELCAGDHTEGGMLMDTDSEALLTAGNALGARTWPRLLAELEWKPEDVDRIVTHQIGAAHRRTMFATLGLDTAKDFPTVGYLGNVGSVSLPISFALAENEGFIQNDHRVAMLGIGSGLHCAMLGVEPA